MAKFFTILLTFSRKNLAYLGKGRLVKDRTSHMDLESGFLPNRRAHNSVIVFAARLLRETGANSSPTLAVCPNFQSDEGIM